MIYWIIGGVVLVIFLIGAFADNHSTTEVHNNARPADLGSADSTAHVEQRNYNLNGYNY